MKLLKPETVRRRRRRIESEFEEVKHRREAAWKVLQERCPHENTGYNQDPAGGHDSFTECLDCMKIL